MGPLYPPPPHMTHMYPPPHTLIYSDVKSTRRPLPLRTYIGKLLFTVHMHRYIIIYGDVKRTRRTSHIARILGHIRDIGHIRDLPDGTVEAPPFCLFCAPA